MILMKSPAAADPSIKKWKTKMFWEPHVGRTIDPKTLIVNVAILNGFPLDVVDAELGKQIQNRFPGVAAIRPKENDKPLCNFREKFNDPTQLLKAIN